MEQFQRAKTKILPWVMLGAVSLLFGCASADNNTSCAQRLDEKSFASVSEDASCSTYERGSAYLGRAGFLFSNFLKEGASNNFRTALGIPGTATWDSWEGKAHYKSARYWTGSEAASTSADSNDYYYGQSRTNADIEIHYFATLANMLAETYVQLDTDGNGKVSEAENQAFTNINPKTAADYGSNDITGTNYFQISTGIQGYVLDINNNRCWTDTNGDGLEGINDPTGASASTLLSCVTAAGGTLSGTCSVIAKVDNVQKMFKTTITSANNVLTMTDSLVASLKSLNADMTALGLPADSDLKKGLNDFTAKVDNGGACTSNASFVEVNQLLVLINAANKTSLGTTSGAYLSANKLALTALQGSSDKTVTQPTTTTTGINCSNAGALDARLVFQTSTTGTYTADYGSANTGISSTFASLRNIQLSADGVTIKPIKKGDDIVAFEELICMQ